MNTDETNHAPQREAQNFNLVLEGGAMRSMFTAGVTDFFLEKGLYPTEAIGVSAGALVAIHYLSGNLGHAAYLNLKYANDWRYLSMRSFVLTGNVAGRDFMFREVPEKLDPIDYDLFNSSPARLTTVCSNLETAEADYHTITDIRKEMDYIIATSSLPLLSRIVEVDGKKLLDGGVCDSIPVDYSLSTGREKHVVVLTRDADYRKKPDRLGALETKVFSQYPQFVEREQMRFYEYNRQARRVMQFEKEGKVFAIRPQRPVEVVQLEKDTDKLFDLYEQGYEQATLNWDNLQRYLGL